MQQESIHTFIRLEPIFKELYLRNANFSVKEGKLHIEFPEGTKISPEEHHILYDVYYDLIAEYLNHGIASIEDVRVREQKFEDNSVFVLDNLLNQKEVLDNYFYYAFRKYSRTELDSDEDKFPILATELDIKETKQTALYEQIISNIAECFPKEEVVLQRAYVNMTQFGDMEYPHRDCKETDKDITALYYVNPHWDLNWGGATEFFENGDDFGFSVFPKPGRLALFRGAIKHLACIPTRTCPISRYTPALKFEVKI